MKVDQFNPSLLSSELNYSDEKIMQMQKLDKKYLFSQAIKEAHLLFTFTDKYTVPLNESILNT